MSNPRLEYLRQKYRLKVGGHQTNRQNSCVFPDKRLTEDQKRFFDGCPQPARKLIAKMVDKEGTPVVAYKIRVPDHKGNLHMLGLFITNLETTQVLHVLLNGFSVKNKFAKEISDVCEALVKESATLRGLVDSQQPEEQASAPSVEETEAAVE